MNCKGQQSVTYAREHVRDRAGDFDAQRGLPHKVGSRKRSDRASPKNICPFQAGVSMSVQSPQVSSPLTRINGARNPTDPIFVQ